MKYLVVLAVILIAAWVWRNNRRAEDAERHAQRAAYRPRQPPAVAAPQDMVRCAICELHLPRGDALAGPGGLLYCSAEHLRRAAA